MSDSIFYVYVHRRIGTGIPFYVGKGHGYRANTHKSRNPHWKNIVAKDGGLEVEFIVKDVSEERAFFIEMETIAKYRSAGISLVNLTDGGDGVSGFRQTKPPHNKGKPCPEEMKARISATLKAKGCLPPIGWNKGKRTPEEIKAKMTASQLKRWAAIQSDGGVVVSEETRAKQRAAKIGKPLSEAHKLSLSVALKANKFTRRNRYTGCRENV